jgi:hypothetical protein
MATTLINLLTQYTPVQDSVLHHLEIKDVLALTKTTKLFSGFMKTVEKTQFHINDALKEFLDPIAFLSLQAKHNFLITGYFAYAVLARKIVDDVRCPGYLHFIVVQEGEHAQALINFLFLQEGYEKEPQENPKSLVCIT